MKMRYRRRFILIGLVNCILAIVAYLYFTRLPNTNYVSYSFDVYDMIDYEKDASVTIAVINIELYGMKDDEGKGNARVTGSYELIKRGETSRKEELGLQCLEATVFNNSNTIYIDRDNMRLVFDKHGRGRGTLYFDEGWNRHGMTSRTPYYLVLRKIEYSNERE